jgi:hypothetical protein
MSAGTLVHYEQTVQVPAGNGVAGSGQAREEGEARVHGDTGMLLTGRQSGASWNGDWGVAQPVLTHLPSGGLRRPIRGSHTHSL